MKTTKWFKTGENIPDNAKYLRTEKKCVGYADDVPAQLPAIPLYEDFHLYEIPASEDK